jgi:hypothetical protein
MKKFVMRVVLVLAGGVSLAAATASPGLAQSDPDPSQIVTLASASGNSTCGENFSRLVIDSMVDPADGSLSPFVIPPRKVLVLTGATWSAGPGIPAGSATTLQVFLNPSLVPVFPPDIPIVVGPSVPASAAGIAIGSLHAATRRGGQAGRPLVRQHPARQQPARPLTVRLYGYLARDR